MTLSEPVGPATSKMEAYRAARASAAIFGRPEAGVIELTGRDRQGWLQGLLTNDVAALPAGSGCYAAWLTPQGRMVTDMRVLVFEAAVWLEVSAATAAALATRLDQLVFSEDVSIRDVSRTVSSIGLCGPSAHDALERAMSAVIGEPWQLPGAPWSEFQHWTLPALPGVEPAMENGGRDAGAIVHHSELGVPVFQLYGRPAAMALVERRLEADETPRLSRAELETLRIESGLPMFGVDMDETTIPLEAGIEERGISFRKGCYVGQEVIVRMTSRGQGRAARRLVGLLCESDGLPKRDTRLLAEGREVGYITSVTWSPRLDAVIALAYVHRDSSAPSTVIELAGSSGGSATVVGLPFEPSAAS